MVLGNMQCCGVMEIHGLSHESSPRSAMQGLVRAWKHCTPRRNLLIFTGTVESWQADYAAQFAAFIKEHNLGEVKKSPVKRNPNSGNHIQVYLWDVKPLNLARWGKANQC